MPQESTAIELSSSLSTNVFRFFFRQSATPPPCTCKGANSTVSKEKILPLGQLVNIFSSLLYDYDCSTIPEGSCFVLMDHGEVLWPETILQRDSNPWPPLWRRSALPTVLWKPIHLEQTDLLLTRESNEDQCHLRRSTHNARLYPTHMGLFIYQLLWTQSCPEGMCTNGTQVPCEVPSLPNPTTRKGWPHHRGLRPLVFSNSDQGRIQDLFEEGVHSSLALLQHQ